MFSIQSCNNNRRKGAVFINFEHGKYVFYRNGHPFLVKGASGFSNLKVLKETGGNTIRVWDTVGLKQVLDSAQTYHLAVIVGLPMPGNNNMDEFYNNEQAVHAHYKRLTVLINRYKHHPALLSWCLGNELAFPNKPNFNRFYQAFNNIISMIHQDDPDHPVTTTIMTFQKKNIVNIKLRTKIDYVSFNIFGSIQSMKKDLDDFNWFWGGPFLITEWGVEGPWMKGEENAWGAYVENTSLKKAEQYETIYKQYMPVNNPRFLGSLVFYWGQKQEFTPTWFSFFDESGARTEMVNTMHYVWTGTHAKYHAPYIKYMLINDKGGNDNLLFKPGSVADSKVYNYSSDTTDLTYKWELLREDWYKDRGYINHKPRPEKHLFILQRGTELKFKAPEKEGPYRLFVYVYNSHGYVATANTPFYVVDNP